MAKFPKFHLGHTVATPAALAVLENAGKSPAEFLRRHLVGDWGDIEEEDKKLNDWSIINNERIFSAYNLGNGERIWIITERDHSATTILLPSEY